MTSSTFRSKLRWRLRQPTFAFGVIALLAMLSFTACVNGGSKGSTPTSTGTPAGNGSMTTAPIQIQDVSIVTAESYPPQIFVEVTGFIPDSCTTARDPEIAHAGSMYTITIIGERPTGMICAQIVSPYKRSIPLGSLDAGHYTVVVNGVSKQFDVS